MCFYCPLHRSLISAHLFATSRVTFHICPLQQFFFRFSSCTILCSIQFPSSSTVHPLHHSLLHTIPKQFNCTSIAPFSAPYNTQAVQLYIHCTILCSIQFPSNSTVHPLHHSLLHTIPKQFNCTSIAPFCAPYNSQAIQLYIHCTILCSTHYPSSSTVHPLHHSLLHTIPKQFNCTSIALGNSGFSLIFHICSFQFHVLILTNFVPCP